MKSRLNRKNVKLRKDEAGYALMWVLVVLILAGIILVPLFLLMTAGLTSSHAHEERMLRFYAADAGIEDAIWKMQNGTPPADPYYLEEPVNGNQVQVTASPGTSSMRWFFEAIMGWARGSSPPPPHTDWVVVYGVSGSNTYTIEVTCNLEKGNKRINGIGAWLYGGNFNLVAGSDKDPDDITYYGNPSFYTKYYAGGTAFVWEWASGKGPEFAGGETKTQTFEFTPLGNPVPNVGWVVGQSKDIYISWSGALFMGSIEAVATDPDTDKTTTVTSYVFGSDKGEVTILAYETN
jgi:hypothetical protein